VTRRPRRGPSASRGDAAVLGRRALAWAPVAWAVRAMAPMRNAGTARSAAARRPGAEKGRSAPRPSGVASLRLRSDASPRFAATRRGGAASASRREAAARPRCIRCSQWSPYSRLAGL